MHFSAPLPMKSVRVYTPLSFSTPYFTSNLALNSGFKLWLTSPVYPSAFSHRTILDRLLGDIRRASSSLERELWNMTLNSPSLLSQLKNLYVPERAIVQFSVNLKLPPC